METAKDSIATSLSGIQKALDGFGNANKGVAEQAVRNNTDLSRSFLELKGSATGGFNAIAGVIERFRGVLAGLAGALAGGFLFKESIADMLRMEDAVRGLIITFGMTSEKATQTAIALKLAGLSADTFEQMGQRVGRMLKTQSEEFDRLKVVTKDVNGNFLPMDDILKNIYARMQDFKAGTDQTEFALSTVGRNAKDFASDMQRLGAATERAAQLQRQLGIEMGPDRIAQVEQYRQNLNAFKLVLETIGEKIGEAALPQLERLAQWFNEYGPRAVSVIVDAIKGLMTVLQGLGAVVGAMVIFAVSRFQNLATEAVAAWQIIKAAASFNFGAIPDITAAANAKITANNQAAAESIVATWTNAKARITALWSDVEAPKGLPSGVPKSGAERFVPKPTGDAGMTQLQLWKQQLDEMRDAEDAFHELSHAAEAAFWASKLELVKKGTKEYAEVYHLMVEAKKGAAKDEYAAQMEGFAQQITAAKNNRDQQLALVDARTEYVKSKYGEESKEFARAMQEQIAARQAWAVKDQQIVAIQAKAAEAAATHDAKMQELAGQQAVAMRQITNQQKFALDQQLEDQLFELKREAIERELAAEKAGPDDPVKIAALNAQLEALEENHQEKITQIKNAAQLEQMQFALQADQAVESSFSNLLSDLVSGTKTWKQSFLDAIKQLDDALVKLAAQKFAQQIFGAGTGGGDFIGSLMGSIFGGGAIAGFAVGTAYVPQDTLAVVHRGEAVIPAQYNKKGALGGSFQVTNHFTISGPVDTRTQDQIAAAAARGVQRATSRNL